MYTPTLSPVSESPTILYPTRAPHPTIFKSHSPTYTTISPTKHPTFSPSNTPTFTPTSAPTEIPTIAPSNAPYSVPTSAPTYLPSSTPTSAPTPEPTNHKTKHEKRKRRITHNMQLIFFIIGLLIFCCGFICWITTYPHINCCRWNIYKNNS